VIGHFGRGLSELARRELSDPKIKDHRGRIVKPPATGCSSSSPASSMQSARAPNARDLFAVTAINLEYR
jgi:hypothetical protein